MAYEPPHFRRNQESCSRAPLHLCIIDITGASAKHSAKVFERFIKETLTEDL